MVILTRGCKAVLTRAVSGNTGAVASVPLCMRHTTLLLTFALALGVSALPAKAASFDPIKVTLPYAVNVGDSTLSAGNYTMLDVRDEGSASIMQMRPDAGGPSALVFVTRMATPGNVSSPKTQFVFRHTEDTYELQKIWVKGANYGFELTHHE